MRPFVIVLLCSSLLLSGCNVLKQPKPANPTASTEANNVAQMQTASQEIADAFNSGKSLTCQVTSSTAGEAPSTYLIKGHKMQMSTQATTGSNTQYYSINDGTTIYMWATDPAVPAMKIDLDTVKKGDRNFDNLLQNFPDLTDPEQRQKLADSGSTITCTETTVDDNEFTPPRGIQFKNFADVIGNTVEK